MSRSIRTDGTEKVRHRGALLLKTGGQNIDVKIMTDIYIERETEFLGLMDLSSIKYS